MPLSELIQRIIHILTVGSGSRVVRAVMVGMIVFTLCLWYDVCNFKNFATPEAMDSAQLARNISEGRGYTTDFVRPLSIYLVQHWNEARQAGKPAGANADFARLQTAHPDLANPPVYPVLLAGLMEILPFDYTVELHKSFWSEGGHFSRFEPDFLIMAINQLLMLAAVWQTFLIARKLLDQEVAWVSAALAIGCEFLWQFSVSGLSTMLLMVIFLGLVRLLIVYEETVREPSPSRSKLFGLAVAVGLLVGVGALTRYAFGWVILPASLFLVWFGGPERWRQVLCCGGAFLLLFAPWVLRNVLVSGTPFGTASFAVMETSVYFPGFQLEQSLHPDLTPAKFITPYFHKLWTNLGGILQNDLPMLGRSWVTLLFFAGLLLPFRRLPVRRLRYFLLMCLATFAVCQAMGQTQLSALSPLVNSENLLVLVTPLLLIYGTVFFFTFLDQMEMPLLVPIQTLRYTAMVIFIGLMSLPMLGALFSGKSDPVVYPPYYPPEIQLSASWMKPNELIMSDMPWAVAWYGHRQSLWLTTNAKADFFAVNDFMKPVKALYLTPLTLDDKFRTSMLMAPPESWGAFVISATILKQTSLPLPSSASDVGLSSGLFLTDRPRWLDTPK